MNAHPAESQDDLKDSPETTSHTTPNSSSNPTSSSFDSLIKYVRILSEPNAKLVMFNCTIAAPTLLTDKSLYQ